jgi:hypothetical protein
MAMPMSYLPSRMVSGVCWMAVAAVPQAFEDVGKGDAGQANEPGYRVRVGHLVAAAEAELDVLQSTPASVSADWIASAPISMAVLSNRPNG